MTGHPTTRIESRRLKFSTLLRDTIRNAEIPLRFEPGAEEAITDPVTELLKAWVAMHSPNHARDGFDYGQKALVVRLIEELEDLHDIPVADADTMA